ncbi:hypothetical protein J3R83DRAFT_3983, partial [Lanmaoa asiatica]
DPNVIIPQPVSNLHTRQRGHPKKHIDLAFLCEATLDSCHIKLMELANVLGVHQNTLRLYMKQHRIKWKYSSLSNGELDQLVAHFKAKRPELGMHYIMGFL